MPTTLLLYFQISLESGFISMQLEPVAPVMHKGLPADVTRVTYTNQQIAWEEQQQTGVMDKRRSRWWTRNWQKKQSSYRGWTMLWQRCD